MKKVSWDGSRYSWGKSNLSIPKSSAIFVGTACPGAGRGRRLPQRMYNTPRRLPPSHRDIIIDLEMELRMPDARVEEV